jgi:hypothetical protein
MSNAGQTAAKIASACPRAMPAKALCRRRRTLSKRLSLAPRDYLRRLIKENSNMAHPDRNSYATPDSTMLKSDALADFLHSA